MIKMTEDPQKLWFILTLIVLEIKNEKSEMQLLSSGYQFKLRNTDYPLNYMEEYD